MVIVPETEGFEMPFLSQIITLERRTVGEEHDNGNGDYAQSHYWAMPLSLTPERADQRSLARDEELISMPEFRA